MKVGLIGYGAIGKDVAQRIQSAKLPGLELISIFSRTRSSHVPIMTTDFSHFLSLKPNLVIEAAGQAAVRTFVPQLVQRGISVAVCSVGAFTDKAFEQQMHQQALRHNAKIYFPSCALGGLDRICAAKEGSLQTVQLQTRKPPTSWYGTEVESRLDLEQLSVPTRVFTGTARQAAQKYPQNANVSAALGLAGGGLDETRVEVWVDPDIHQNVHVVSVQGDSGLFSFEIRNAPSENPKTGVIVAMSIMKLLRNLHDPFVIGI
ncbi:aspartate dehydrogenase [Alicyclobacillus sp. SO9]|uniref:aspartate dehydrogenase n=1 Tax=Alicyclobacillus sp. SO9 TaxID=2665646 RepID=UPI0018E722E7|nr:aspartate dehydrogenase [Alicyclobacillus sp. SO9]QQE78649.1 aspartate dehydrogenase [Alicyclobacillus sp. SO9]